MKRQNALQFLLKNIAISHLEHSYGEGVAGRVVGETHLMMAMINDDDYGGGGNGD